MVDYYLQSGRIYDKDGNIVNLVGLFGDGCVPVDSNVYDPEDYVPSNGRVLGEDGKAYALVDILRNIAGGWPGYGSKGQHVWIRYATKKPTANSDMKPTVDAWMGVYTGMRDRPPESYADFSWYQIKGATGAKGATGPQGVSVANAAVNAAGNLILTLSSGDSIDCGLARGDMSVAVYGGSAPGVVAKSDNASKLVGINGAYFMNLGNGKPVLPVDADLDDYKTPGAHSGTPSASVATYLNCPVNIGFELLVSWPVNSASYVVQDLSTYTNIRFTRYFTQGSWKPWKPVPIGAPNDFGVPTLEQVALRATGNPVWQELELLNGFTKNTGIWLMRDEYGWCQLTGTFYRAEIPTSGLGLAVLPVGYRPTRQITCLLAQPGSDDKIWATHANINTNGTVNITGVKIPTNFSTTQSIALMAAAYKAAI